MISDETLVSDLMEVKDEWEWRFDELKQQALSQGKNEKQAIHFAYSLMGFTDRVAMLHALSVLKASHPIYVGCGGECG
jgi:hypothetical protein